MVEWIKPTRRKFKIVLLCILFFLVLPLTQLIPPQYDLLDLKDGANFILKIVLSLPVRMFDLLTGGTFRPRECYVFCFPTPMQLAFLAVFDLAIFYLGACIYCKFVKKRELT